MNNNFYLIWKNYLKKNPCPKQVILEITNECTVGTCSHCYISAKKIGKGKYLNLNVFKSWINVFKQLKKPDSVLVTGGEPTLHPNLIYIVKTLKQLKIKTILASNGKTLNNKIWFRLTPYLDEIQISLRGNGLLHDLLTLPAEDKIWKQIPRDITQKQQIVKALRLIKNQKTSQYKSVLETLKEIKKIKSRNGFKLNLNIDIQVAADLVKCVYSLSKEGIKIDDINLQVTQPVGRAKIFPNVIPNLWRKPDTMMVKKYIISAQYLLREKIISGKIMIIDPLPYKIVKKFHLQDAKWQWFYKPDPIPAISVNGYLRPNVVG